MMNHILLASHGTEGAQAAVKTAINLAEKGTEIHHLTVVPNLWKGMMGDDWLNNGITRDRYARYLESELGKEIDNHCDTVKQQAASRGIRYTQQIVVGEPDQCLIDYSREQAFDLVVIGSPRPKGKPGLRSRMNTKVLTESLSVPLMVAPYPDDH